MSDMLNRWQFHWDNTRQRMIDNGHSSSLLRTVVLRLFAALFALLGLSLFAAAIQPWNMTFVHAKSPIKGDWQDALPIIPLLASFMFNFLAAYYSLWYAKPVHAVLAASTDLLVWAVLIPGVVFAAWGGTFNLWQSPIIEPAGELLCTNKMNIFAAECFPALYQIGGLELAGVVFGTVVWILTTFLFFHGVAEAIRRRRSDTAAFDKRAFVDLERASPSRNYHHYQYRRPSQRSRHNRQASSSPQRDRRGASRASRSPPPYPRPIPVALPQMSSVVVVGGGAEFAMPQVPARAMPRYG